jgi:hypothetical protein
VALAVETHLLVQAPVDALQHRDAHPRLDPTGGRPPLG